MGAAQDHRQDVSALHYVGLATTDSALQQSVALAAERFGFAVGMVNVLDAASQHTLASVGASLGRVARSGTLCDAVVRSGCPVVLGDVRVPPVSAPAARAYVAVPLIGREGLVIGTLCLLDTRPRSFGAEQMVQLVAIAAVVQDQLEMLRCRGPRPAGSLADTAELAAAVDNGQVVPFYQPVIDLDTGQVSAVEALARWTHPVRGVVAPVDFIPLAEDTDIVIDLDMAVLRHAVTDFARWRPQHPSLRLNGNLSGRHFAHPDCVERITAATTTSGVAPEAVNLEVTETVAIAEDRGFLTELRERGFQILLDDFGTGFSSVKQMLRLPIDGIKLDRTITAAVGTRVGDAVVRALVGLAADLDLSMVIEGVETPEQAARVRELGCTHAQGYLWTPPVPAPEIADLLAPQHRPDTPHGTSGTRISRPPRSPSVHHNAACPR